MEQRTRGAGDSGSAAKALRHEDRATQSAVAHFVGSGFVDASSPGVSLRSTPGFMLPSASRTQKRSSPGLAVNLRKAPLFILFALLTACHSVLPATPLSAGALLREYQNSSTDARLKYDGKEISVRGLALATATLPLNSADQGSVWLQESDRETVGKVGCWFSSQQAADFSRIVSGQHVTIKGIFNGEAGVELKFCRLVKVE